MPNKSIPPGPKHNPKPPVDPPGKPRPAPPADPKKTIPPGKQP